MAHHNQAAWLSLPNAHPLEVMAADFPSNVKAGHVIIKVAAVAINPVDFKMQEHGVFVSSYPAILGCDVAGTVYDINVDDPDKTFREGDRVMAEANAIGSQDTAEGAFQLYVSCHSDLVSKIPDHVSFKDACTLPLALTTAGMGLYGKAYLALPYPSITPSETGNSVLIWGGSSSVGSAAIQLASASGMHVIATASKRHHDFCGSLGANAVFDYNASDVDEQILNMVSNRSLVGVFDAISTPSSRTPIGSILQQLDGGFVASVSQPAAGGPKNVTEILIMAPRILTAEKGAAEAVWRHFAPQALEKDILKPAPPAHVVGKGLEKIQEGLDLLKKGVSGQKLVVEFDY